MKKANAPAPADVQVLLPAAMMNGKAVVDSGCWVGHTKTFWRTFTAIFRPWNAEKQTG